VIARSQAGNWLWQMRHFLEVLSGRSGHSAATR